MSNLYLYLDLFTLAAPLALSFDKKVAFYKEWKYLFPSILIMASIFLAWDVLFNKYGVWGFNDAYLIGTRVLGLPLEEWLFFIVVPYACVFIYACLQAYLRVDPLKKIHRPFLLVLSVLLIALAIWNYQKLYTSITFALAAAFILYNLWKKSPWLSIFLLSYFVTLIPFLIVNGYLTGSWIHEQVVWYNPDHILNIRIGTIPIEDTIYNMAMLIGTVQLFEGLKNKYA